MLVIVGKRKRIQQASIILSTSMRVKLFAGWALLVFFASDNVCGFQKTSFHSGTLSKHKYPLRGPDFWVVGGQKCGTSSMWKYLTEHNSIMSMSNKESFVFNDPYGKQKCKNFNYSQWLKKKYQFTTKINPRVRIGEFTASHLECACCLDLIHKHTPNASIITILRDPARRVISRYYELKKIDYQPWMNYYSDESILASRIDVHVQYVLDLVGLTQYPPDHSEYFYDCGKHLKRYGGFSAFVAAESKKIANCLMKRKNEPFQKRSFCVESSNVLGWSFYNYFLPNLLKSFDTDKVHFLYTEDLEFNALNAILKVEDFLEIPRYVSSRIGKAYNTQGHLGWRHDIDSSNYSSAHLNIEEYEAPPAILCETLAGVYLYVKQLAANGILPPIPETWGCREYWE